MDDMKKAAAEYDRRHQEIEQKRKRKEYMQESSEALMHSILMQLERGDPAEATLYVAIRCLAVLTGQDDWAEQCCVHLSQWEILAQETLNNDAAAERINAQQDARMRQLNSMEKRINTEIKKTDNYRMALTAMLRELKEAKE